MSNAFFWPLWVLYSGAHAHTQTCSSKYKLIKIKPLKILFIRCLCVVPCTWTGGAKVSMVHVEARGQLGVTILWERATVVFETGSLTEIWDQWSRAGWLARKPGICLSPPPQNCAYKTHTTMPGF